MTNIGAVLIALFQTALDPFRRREDRGFDTKPKKKTPMIAICVGHSRSGDRGAQSVGGVSEWDFNQPLAYSLKQELAQRGIAATIIDVYDGNGYTAAMSWLSKRLTAINADAAIELHFNAASPSATGYEHLYWGRSERGERLAKWLNVAQADRFPGSKNRGVKALGAGDRGATFLRVTPCPAVIVEPFFGSNKDEWAAYSAQAVDLVTSWADGIESFFKSK